MTFFTDTPNSPTYLMGFAGKNKAIIFLKKNAMVNQGAFEGPQGSGWPAGCRPRGWEGSLSYRLPDATRTQPEILNPLGCWTDVVMFLIKKNSQPEIGHKNPEKENKVIQIAKKKRQKCICITQIFFCLWRRKPCNLCLIYNPQSRKGKHYYCR